MAHTLLVLNVEDGTLTLTSKAPPRTNTRKGLKYRWVVLLD